MESPVGSWALLPIASGVWNIGGIRKQENSCWLMQSYGPCHLDRCINLGSLATSININTCWRKQIFWSQKWMVTNECSKTSSTKTGYSWYNNTGKPGGNLLYYAKMNTQLPKQMDVPAWRQVSVQMQLYKYSEICNRVHSWWNIFPSACWLK